MAYDRLAAGGKDLGPKYRLRGDRAGASGHTRLARLKSRSRECRPPLRPPSAALLSSLPGSFPWCRGGARCPVKQPGLPGDAETREKQDGGPSLLQPFVISPSDSLRDKTNRRRSANASASQRISPRRSAYA